MTDLEVVWTPPTPGAPVTNEPIFKAHNKDGAMSSFYAYHREAGGRRFYRVPDTPQNRELVATRGKDWGLAPPAADTLEKKKADVCAALTRLGIQHRGNMKLESLVEKLPEIMRSAFR